MKILFCDDEPAILDMYLSELEECYPDITFFRALNGREGLNICLNEKIDFVFTDGKMPVMDGKQLAQNLSNLENKPNVYMITGYAGTYQEDTLTKSGVKEIFYKPIDFDWLIDFVGQIIKMN